MKSSFRAYLESKGFTARSIATYRKSLEIFTGWLEKQGIQAEAVRYADMLAFMKSCTARGLSRRTVQNYLVPVRHYYDHLIREGAVATNPAARIKVRGVKKQILYPILEPPRLHGLYNSYQDETLKGKRNKVMLGLMVYQGVRSQELARLEVNHIKLREGKIEVPGGRTSNGRVLVLESHQVLDMYDYILQTRGKILEKSHQQTQKLFVSPEGGEIFSNFMAGLMRRLRADNSHLINGQQIRTSVIVKWLKLYNLREVQYRAGHRYVSSTECYRHSEMEGLLEEVNQFHPL